MDMKHSPLTNEEIIEIHNRSKERHRKFDEQLRMEYQRQTEIDRLPIAIPSGGSYSPFSQSDSQLLNAFDFMNRDSEILKSIFATEETIAFIRERDNLKK